VAVGVDDAVDGAVDDVEGMGGAVVTGIGAGVASGDFVHPASTMTVAAQASMCLEIVFME
jgi:hypothetical protein